MGSRLTAHLPVGAMQQTTGAGIFRAETGAGLVWQVTRNARVVGHIHRRIGGFSWRACSLITHSEDLLPTPEAALLELIDAVGGEQL